ncbi:aminotransferase class I/II-fold pyridoxal phosphate-dependent enzyme [Pseudomonas sp. BP8]|uniref:pyoverdine biosynthesis transaminase PtaA n=1 Tax=Pseudomonas sp. BP8 TaxID=2817864 RepID=UPI001AE8EFAB|nr:aminotransferase class I/II-fold pyridoxal phosphate-dependent enzyme [Pseudomonas sp. BP8]MBP2261318.1 histidinol-phosphate aminotransferase [Pseudomonas sp. BP8]HDS1734308.1 aminotransferase class I/II-fold pyridoxal phosphate-dependent enzyme [Pseudomonas putida]
MSALSRRRFVAAATLTGLAPAIPAWAAGAASDPPVDDDIIRLDYNESPYGPCPSALDAMSLGTRQSGHYFPEHEYRLAELFARQHQVPEDHVAVFCGSRSPLQYALARHADKRGVVTAAPTYDSVANGARAVGATLHEVPLDARHAHDVRGMLAADPQPGVLYLCNPNNPTGTLTPRADIEHLVSQKPAGSLAIIDEAYIHFSDAPSCLDLAVSHDNVLVLRTFSKLYGMAGARLGLAIGKPALLEDLQRLNGYNFVPLAAAMGGIASLQQEDLVSERKRINRQILLSTTEALQKAGYRCTDAHANCFMVALNRPAKPVIQALAQRQIRVGRVFQAWPEWMRVSVGTAEQMQTFLKAFFDMMQR